MSLKFKYTPLSFLKNDNQIKEQIRNTVILKCFFDLNNKKIDLQKLIEGTQYGYNASALESGANKFLRISDITDGKVDWDKVPFCDCKDESTYLLENEDLLIARTGGTTGKSFLINNPPDKAIYAGYLIRIRANQNSLPEYLNLFLNSYAYWSQVLSLNKGEFRPSVNATKLKRLQLPNCSIEQQRVAIKLSKGESVIGYESLTERIELALNQFQKGRNLESLFQTQKSLLTQLKQAILQEAIQGKLTRDWRVENPELITGENSAATLLENIKAEKAQLVKEKKIKKEKPLPPIEKEEIPFELPEGWVWCRLGAVITYLNGKGFNSTDFQKHIGVKCIKITNAGVGEIIPTNDRLPLRFKEKHKEYLVYTNDIIIALTRPYISEGLKASLCPSSYNESLLNQRVAVIRGTSTSNKYIYKYLRSDFVLNGFKNEFDSKGQQPNLKNEHIRHLIFPLPPLEEQKVMEEKVEILMEKCTALEQEITKSEQHAKMLMQAVLKEAFEGGTKNLEPA